MDSTHDEAQYLEAVKTLDLNLCKTIVEDRLKHVCQDTILLEQAQKSNNISLCSSISDGEKKVYCIEKAKTHQDIALFKRASESKDLRTCTSIMDTNLKNRCHDVITLELVKTSKNTKLCDTLTNTGIIENCKRIENQ